MKTVDFDFQLPPELIAQRPPQRRDQSRMMVVDRAVGAISHHGIADIGQFLRAGDLLVVNNTRVFPARLFGHREGTGGKVEVLLLERLADSSTDGGSWEAFFRASAKAAPGMRLSLADGLISAEITENRGGGRMVVQLTCPQGLDAVMETHGVPPVPPYIKRDRDPNGKQIRLDRDRYQTVYASCTGAVAAPTAGLHFTPELLASLASGGIDRAEVTLHVGPGTFQPVKVDTVEEHRMESERYSVSRATADALAAATGRIVAVGSTSVRTLETVAGEHGQVVAGDGRSEIFIYPPYEFRVVEAMLTNFHLPCSSLLMMVSALAGTDLIREAYAQAVRERYRFYSYGDCMLIV